MKVLAIGELTVDWLSLTSGESMLTACNFYRYPGGNAANVGIVASRLGLNVEILAKIGDDLHGQYLLAALAENKLDLSQVIVDGNYGTAQCYMTRNADGSPVYSNWPRPHAAQMLEIKDIDSSRLAACDLMHCTGISLVADPRRKAVLEAVKTAKEKGVIIAFDACFPTGQSKDGEQAARSLMDSVDIIKVNLAELAFWSGGSIEENPEKMAQKLLQDIKPAALVVTLGKDGAQIYLKEGMVQAKAYPVDCLCDVGAGDAFMAGLYYGLSKVLSGRSKRNELYSLPPKHWREILKPACLAGALATREIGATEKFPLLPEFERALESHAALVD